MSGTIRIRGAREHNLRIDDLELPRGRWIVITGVSGSGKSSLAFDTIFREGERRFLETLSPGARRAIGRIHKPRVTSIEGLSPAIAIDARSAGGGPWATVATIAGVDDLLRLLFARLGVPHCPSCGRRIEASPPGRIADAILRGHAGREVWILAPLVREGMGDAREILSHLREQGFARARIDGEVVRLADVQPLDPARPHAIEVVCDRVAVAPERRSRIEEAVETAAAVGDGAIALDDGGVISLWNTRLACAECGGAFPVLSPSLFTFRSPLGACPACRGLGAGATGEPCGACGGRRLGPASLAVRLRDRSIADIASLSVGEAMAFFESLDLAGLDRAGDALAIGGPIVARILESLSFLAHVGLGYIGLDRTAESLAGGEAQRARLAAGLGAELRGVLYVLDEPSVGLHPRDLEDLLRAIARLRDRGNTVIVVEHDRDAIEAADHVVDIGPGAGRDGGRVMAQGPPEAIASDPESVTGRHLSGAARIPAPGDRPEPGSASLVIRGARHHNLRGIDVRIPLGCLVAVTGVSGSGKSSLIAETLLPAAARALGDKRARPGAHDALDGAEHIDGVVAIDQSPIGRTPRSNPATYTGMFDAIRALFARLPESQARGYGPERFSFNARGGRCEECRGAGRVRVDLEFLADVEVSCEACRGRRYNRETLEIRYRGMTIADVLAAPVADAIRLFDGEERILAVLSVLDAVGLGYVPIGQSATTLSSGEAQRVKLAAALARPARERTLYILDEPTRGLHFEDVGRLIRALRSLIARRGSVVIIEHHTDVIAAADHVIDLGPGAGPEGGAIVAQGPPEAIAADPNSHTGRALARMGRERLPRAAAIPLPAAPPGTIEVRGARTHNLRSIDADIPCEKLTVVTGPSGAGKTSLVFDTIHAEARRRYLDALSTRARMLAGKLERPPVDRIDGLAPSIAVDRAAPAAGPRATAATASEIHDLLRLLWARAGEPYCPRCDVPLRSFSPSRAAEDAIARFDGEVGYILAALEGIEATGAAPPRRDADALVRWLLAEGFTRLLLGGREVGLEDGTPEIGAGEDEFLVIDRVRFESGAQGRIAASFEEAYRRASGRAAAAPAGRPVERYARLPTCPTCTFALGAPLAPRHFSAASPEGACPRCGGRGEILAGRGIRKTCPDCAGERIRPAFRAVRVGEWRMAAFLRLPIERALAAIDTFGIEGGRAQVAEPILADLRARLRFLADVGLGYIALDRRAETLSAGEAQRIRLAAQLGAALSGALYVLDEPSLGLHPRDVERIAASLRALRDRGNTVIVVEQDEGLIRAADHVIELGPGGGRDGGAVVAAGPPAGVREAPLPRPARGADPAGDRGRITVGEARLHNLKGFDVAFPRGRVTVVAGVSGSGKSTLVEEILAPGVRAALRGARAISGCRAIDGVEGIARVAALAASPIGRTPAAIPATYAGIFGAIRSFFALLPVSRRKGFDPSRFSFNRPAGRCPACRGLGHVRVRMEILADLWIPCEACGTRRYNRETLEVRYRGKTIADVLSATVREAIALFRDHPRIAPVLALLARAGLGSLPLGQPGNTLSAGEAQRLRIARVLGAPRRGETLYILDEPTSGLAAREVDALGDILEELAARGDTVVVIEHHLRLIRRADWLIELGPEAGERGGHLLHEGPPEGLAANERSPTAPYLRPPSG